MVDPAGNLAEAVQIVWPGQKELIFSDAPTTALLTSAGYGKSWALCERIVIDHAKQDYWWKGRSDYQSQPILLMVGAAHEAYLAENTVPILRATIDKFETRLGRSLRKKTGRDRDGWFGSIGHRRQEFANCTEAIIKAFPTKENAVAVTCAGLYFDEVTMLSDVEIWRRSLQRVRDPRVMLRPDGTPHHYVACVGTPEEDHFIHDVLIDPMTGKPLPGTRIIMGSSIDNPVLPLRWFENQAHASPLFKEMQVMGRWVRGAGGQRFAHVFNEKKHVVDMTPPANPKGIFYDLGWDPGFATGSVIIAWQRPRDGVWFVVDEIVIERQTTDEVCREIKRRGYGRHNIRMISMDPRDANKQRSTSRVTDEQLVYQNLGIRPKIHHVAEKTGGLSVRLDVIDEMLAHDRLFFSGKLKPRGLSQLGVINSVRNFALNKTDEDPEKFVDKPTRDTIQRWKHSIDAMHYIFMQYERGVYQKAIRSPSRIQLQEDI